MAQHDRANGERAGRVVVFGGSGFIGRGLARWLFERGYEVLVISRSRPRVAAVGWQPWDGRTVGDWTSRLDGAVAVVNVVGRSVDCRKTPEQRDEILRSRLDSVRAIGHALRHCDAPPPVWVQAGSTHIFGDPAEAVCDESSWPGEGFAPHVCTRWEAAFEAERPADVRGVVLRMSFVLGADGGPLTRLMGLVRRGLGGRVGSGRQWISWVHQHDVNRLFERAIRWGDMEGAYNATAPKPVRQVDFMAELRRAMGRPWSPPVPGPLVRIGARLMRTDPELALLGRHVVPGRLAATRYAFAYPELTGALRQIVDAVSSRGEGGEPKATNV